MVRSGRMRLTSRLTVRVSGSDQGPGAGVLGIPAAADRDPLGAEVAIEIDPAAVRADVEARAVGVDDIDHPQVEAGGGCFWIQLSRDGYARGLVSVNAADHEDLVGARRVRAGARGSRSPEWNGRRRSRSYSGLDEAKASAERRISIHGSCTRTRRGGSRIRIGARTLPDPPGDGRGGFASPLSSRTSRQARVTRFAGTTRSRSAVGWLACARRAASARRLDVLHVGSAPASPPGRGWRRWGTDDLVRLVLRVVSIYAAANPGAGRVGIGDLSGGRRLVRPSPRVSPEWARRRHLLPAPGRA